MTKILFLLLVSSPFANAKEALNRFDGIYDLKSAEGSFKVNQTESSTKIPASDICKSELTLKGEMFEYQPYLKLKPEPVITFEGLNTDPITKVGDRIHYMFDSRKHLNNNSSVSRFMYQGVRLVFKVFNPKCGSPLSRFSSSRDELSGEREDWISMGDANGKMKTIVIDREKLTFKKKGDSLTVNLSRRTGLHPNEELEVEGAAVCIYTKRK